MRLKKISRSLISAADGVVEPAASYPHARPPRPLHKGGFAAFLLMSRPPLLVEEGLCTKSRTRASFPALAKAGWPRHQERCCEASLNGADGAVRLTTD